MNGEWLGSRAIRVNWANQKTQTGPTRTGGGGGGGGGSPMMGGGGPGGPPGAGVGGGYQPPSRMGMGAPSGMSAAPMGGSSMGMGGLSHHTAPPPSMGGSYSPAPTLSYEAVAAQTPEYNATVYVGNLIPFVTQADLIPLFQGYGYIVEIRMQSDRGFAFVKLDSHHNAAMAITHLQNQMVHGRGIKCSWGKDKAPDGSTGAASPAPPQQYQAQMVCPLPNQTHFPSIPPEGLVLTWFRAWVTHSSTVTMADTTMANKPRLRLNSPPHKPQPQRPIVQLGTQQQLPHTTRPKDGEDTTVSTTFPFMIPSDMNVADEVVAQDSTNGATGAQGAGAGAGASGNSASGAGH